MPWLCLSPSPWWPSVFFSCCVGLVVLSPLLWSVLLVTISPVMLAITTLLSMDRGVIASECVVGHRCSRCLLLGCTYVPLDQAFSWPPLMLSTWLSFLLVGLCLFGGGVSSLSVLAGVSTAVLLYVGVALASLSVLLVGIGVVLSLVDNRTGQLGSSSLLRVSEPEQMTPEGLRRTGIGRGERG